MSGTPAASIRERGTATQRLLAIACALMLGFSTTQAADPSPSPPRPRLLPNAPTAPPLPPNWPAYPPPSPPGGPTAPPYPTFPPHAARPPSPQPLSPSPQPPSRPPRPSPPPRLASTPASVNWTATGRMTPVKYYGTVCDCSWAAASMTVVEAALAIQYPNSPPTQFSYQILISCMNNRTDTFYGASDGCRRADPEYAFVFMSNFTIPLAVDYPFTAVYGQNGHCYKNMLALQPSHDNFMQLADPGSYVYQSINEARIMELVAQQPVFCYWVTTVTWMAYVGGVGQAGIYPADDCSDLFADTTNSLVIVGYSTADRYWIVQNSWGVRWGENGFARVRMTGTSGGPCAMYRRIMAPTTFQAVPTFISNSVSPPPPPSPEPPPPSPTPPPPSPSPLTPDLPPSPPVLGSTSPPSGGSSSSPIGAIIGGVVGGIGALIAAVFLFVFLRRRRAAAAGGGAGRVNSGEGGAGPLLASAGSSMMVVTVDGSPGGKVVGRYGGGGGHKADSVSSLQFGMSDTGPSTGGFNLMEVYRKLAGGMANSGSCSRTGTTGDMSSGFDSGASPFGASSAALAALGLIDTIHEEEHALSPINQLQMRESLRMDLDWDRDVVIYQDQFLGDGAMGIVLKGSYEDRPVAIKILKPELLGSLHEDADSFRHELMILARLNHPNVVLLYGGCLKPPQVFLVMELMHQSLADYIKSCRTDNFPLDKVFQIAKDILSGLAYLHSLDVIHRDMKPLNVLLDENGNAKISDFGLARGKYKTYLSTKKVEVGTVAYMPPECFNDKYGGITVKADVYSFGIMMWEMLTLSRPWETMDHIRIITQVAIMDQRPLFPESGNEAGRCPAALRALVEACWSSYPRDRPTSAEALEMLLSAEREYLSDGQASCHSDGDHDDGTQQTAFGSAAAAAALGLELSIALSSPEDSDEDEVVAAQGGAAVPQVAELASGALPMYTSTQQPIDAPHPAPQAAELGAGALPPYASAQQ